MDKRMEYNKTTTGSQPLGYFDDDPNPQQITHRYYAYCDDCDWFSRGFYPVDVTDVARAHGSTSGHALRYEWSN